MDEHWLFDWPWVNLTSAFPGILTQSNTPLQRGTWARVWEQGPQSCPDCRWWVWTGFRPSLLWGFLNTVSHLHCCKPFNRKLSFPRGRIMKGCLSAHSLQSCPTLCDPMDCSPPDSSVHGTLQARIWSGLPCPPPGDLPEPGIEPESPAL